MSAKNRAFALAVGTAALFALAAPVASAATFGGPNTAGFNGDSIVNTSGNQIPLQACNNDIPVNAGVLAGQVPVADLSALLGLADSGNTTSEANRSCTQTPTQSDPSTTSTSATSNSTEAGPNADPKAGPNAGSNAGSNAGWNGGWNTTATGGRTDNTSGFNGDSIVNTSNNQIPLQACNNDIPVNAGLGVVQVPVDGVSGALGILSSGDNTSQANRTCDQTPSQSNPSSTTSTSGS